jgi:glycopeptide antibiotics resistance protein
MHHFLQPFSESLVLSLVYWPFMCILLTVPLIVARLVVQRRATWGYVIFSYALVLYLLGLGLFTLYPMPDNSASFCAKQSLSPQLIPFHWIVDAMRLGKHITAALQVIANICFFMPLGAFVALYFRKHIRFAIVAGLGLSFLIEIAQLTGFFHIYPCSYRLFDVDDLAMNTLGAALGYTMTFRLKKYLKSQPLNAEPVKNNLANHFLAGCIDAVAIMLIASVSAMILRVYAPAIYQISPQAILILWWIAWEWIVPKICHGWTFGRYLVGVEKRKKRR